MTETVQTTANLPLARAMVNACHLAGETPSSAFATLALAIHILNINNTAPISLTQLTESFHMALNTMELPI